MAVVSYLACKSPERDNRRDITLVYLVEKMQRLIIALRCAETKKLCYVMYMSYLLLACLSFISCSCSCHDGTHVIVMLPTVSATTVVVA